MNTSPPFSNGIPNVTPKEEVCRSGWPIVKCVIFDNSTATPPTKTALTKPTEDDVTTTTKEDTVAPPIVVQVRQRNTSIEEYTEKENEETSEDKESTEDVLYHSSDTCIKRSFYKQWVTTKTEVTSLTAVIKETKREAKEDAAENGVLLRRIAFYKTVTNKAEVNIAKLRKDLKMQTKKTTDENIKYKDMVE